jgi:hypothetical protein
MPEEVVGIEHSRRCNIIFWMVYILDREFGPLMGAPGSIRDDDITAKEPSEMDSSLEALNMSLNVRLSRLVARILTGLSANIDMIRLRRVLTMEPRRNLWRGKAV